jgi:uncharacterized protein YbjT (DUF2867 family)
MRAIVFGATGMVGQGVLRECLLDPEVERVLTIGRTVTGKTDPKLREIAHADLYDFSDLESQVVGYDACFFCLGITSAGMNEADYRRVTVDIAAAAGRMLAKVNPTMTFVFISGAGSDGTGKSSTMWARVKGEGENAILALPFKGYAMRPAFIQPRNGITSKTTLYRVLYAVFAPLYPVLKAIAPKHVTTSDAVGRAMLIVAKRGYDKRVIENDDINAIARGEGGARS